MSLDLRGRYPASQTIPTAGSSPAAEICARRQSPNRVGRDSKAETTTRGARFLRLRHNTLCSLRRSSSRTGFLALPSLDLVHRKHALQSVDAFEGMLAAVFERHAGGGASEIGDGARHQHLTRRGQPADPRRDVHGTAVDVAAAVGVGLADHVPGVEPEVQRETGVVASTGAGERGLDGLAGGGEDRKDTIAEELALDRRAGVLADDGAESAVQL